MRSVGRKTFFRRGERWVESGLTDEQERKAQKIERFSKEYFALIDRHGADVAKYLTFEEPVVLELGGSVYAF